MSTDKQVILETRGLTRRYRQCDAVVDLDLRVREGSVFAYLGPNGAGKTTTIRLVLNLIHPSSGEARVLGRPSRELGRKEYAEIGYVSADQALPLDLTVEGMLRHLAPMYPAWDRTFAAHLTAQFDLPRDRRIGRLSRGMRRKAALVGALAHRPRLLVLDEPFSGLDPLVRDEFLQGIVELTEQEQWTIFISTHDIDEVEQLADRVGILNQGRLELEEGTEELQGRFRRIDARTASAGVLEPGLPSSWFQASWDGRHLQYVESRYEPGATAARLQEAVPGAEITGAHPMTLKEIYLVLAREFRLADRKSHEGKS